MPNRCLILACGNTLRGDDGVGPWLANWAEEHFRDQPDVAVIARQQWTPDLAQDIVRFESILFVDSSLTIAPGAIELQRIADSKTRAGIATHHMEAAQLLDLCRELYGVVPRNSLLLTVGIASIELGETFSQEVQASLQEACQLIGKLVANFDESTVSSNALNFRPPRLGA